MPSMLRRRLVMLSCILLCEACTANRPVQVAPTAEALEPFLASEGPTDLEVTDIGGKKTWLHGPSLVGDSIVGLDDRKTPPLRTSVPLSDVASIAQPHFSGARTMGLASGVIVAIGVGLVLVSEDEAEPIY